MIDRDIHTCRALVVDGNATSRSILVAQLREFGVGTVVQCGRAVDARTQLEFKPFDIVLCEQWFGQGDYSGQQLLDDLRRAQLLPLSTVFVMITSEASYAKVTEAAESALDSYLLKPHTATALADRLRHARRRKRILGDIFKAIDEGRFDDAANLCLQRFRARSEFWLFAARIGCELLLNLNRPAEARELFEAVLEAQAVPWAKLGIARSSIAANEPQQAVRTLEALIAEQPGFVDAYDVMARLQVDQGRFDDALQLYRQAATLTPGSVGRLQKLGMLAFLLGDSTEAARHLERAVALGIRSKAFDLQSLAMLAFARHAQKDTKGLQRCVDNLAHAMTRAKGSRRVERLWETAYVLNEHLNRQDMQAVLETLGSEVREEDFDLEAACNLLALLSRLAAAEAAPAAAAGWVDAIALRYATTRSLTELLARVAAEWPAYSERVRAAHQRISETAESALAHSLAGNPAGAVRQLMTRGRQTLNGKLLDNARSLLQRHAAKIPDAEALAAEVDDLRRRFPPGNRIALGDGTRQPGAIALRTSHPLTADEQAEAAAAAAAERAAA